MLTRLTWRKLEVRFLMEEVALWCCVLTVWQYLPLISCTRVTWECFGRDLVFSPFSCSLTILFSDAWVFSPFFTIFVSIIYMSVIVGRLYCHSKLHTLVDLCCQMFFCLLLCLSYVMTFSLSPEWDSLPPPLVVEWGFLVAEALKFANR